MSKDKKNIQKILLKHEDVIHSSTDGIHRLLQYENGECVTIIEFDARLAICIFRQ